VLSLDIVMVRLRPSRFVAVAIIFAVPLLLVNCSHIVFAVVNAPSYIGPYERHADIRYGTEARQSLDVYVPRGAALRPVVVFWYGGVWSRGEKEQYRFVGAALANSGYVAVLPDYRLYPQARFPQFAEDGAAAVKWAREHASEFGGDPHAIFLMGHSAGAHIAATVALDGRYLRKLGGDTEWVRGWIGLSGPYALETSVPFLRDMFPAPFGPADWQLIALVHEKAPPALLLHGLEDYLVFAEEAVELDYRLQAAGVYVECRLYEEASHMDPVAAFSLPFRAEAPSLEDVTNFIDRTVALRGAAPPSDAGAPCPEVHRRPSRPLPPGWHTRDQIQQLISARSGSGEAAAEILPVRLPE
jgi:acetyl esterase/lipase